MSCSGTADVTYGSSSISFVLSNCSTTQSYSCIAITNHKTGNNIQIVDQDTAAAFRKATQRKGYGIMAGLKG